MLKNLLILGKTLIVLNGLNNLNILKTLKAVPPFFNIKFIIADTATKKSKQFQGSLKYVFDDKTNPKAIIFIIDSVK